MRADSESEWQDWLVDTDTPGFIREKKLEKLGMHASDTALLAFQDVRVPDSAVLGQASSADVLGKDQQAGGLAKKFDIREITEATAISPGCRTSA